VVCLLLAGTGTTRADEQADMKAVVEKAIKATGGKAKLARLKEFTVKGKGTAEADNKKIPFTIEASVQKSGRFRMELNAEDNGRAINFLLVINGDKGWIKVADRQEKAPKEIMEALKADAYALRLAQRLLHLLDKDVKLSPLGEVKVGDNDAVGVKVERKGQLDVSLFFDKKTGLPIKCELMVKDSPNGQELSHEYLFSDFKDLGGIKHFGKVILNRDGKKLLEVELSEVNPEEKLDKTLFEKP
jgi:outer membrane lipoprotein-sorting protein